MELAILTPLLVAVLLLVVLAGRLVLARQEVGSAAADAARAASLAATPASAQLVAEQAVSSDLESHRVTCSTESVSVDTADFSPGGSVSVSVSCKASLSGLSLLRVPGSAILSSRDTEVIDRYRALGTP